MKKKKIIIITVLSLCLLLIASPFINIALALVFPAHLSEAREENILAVYRRETGNEDAGIEIYCGRYRGADVAMFSGWFATANIWTDNVGGVLLPYNSGQQIEVVKNGKVYTLSEAYDEGILWFGDIIRIKYLYIASN